MRNRRLLPAVTCALSSQIAGCSWIFVQKAPDGPVERAPPATCTSSAAAPIADTVLASVLAAGGLALVIGAATKPGPSDPYAATVNAAYTVTVAAAGGVLAASAIPWAFSAAYGYSHTADCREVKQSQLDCLSGVEDSCRLLRERAH